MKRRKPILFSVVLAGWLALAGVAAASEGSDARAFVQQANDGIAQMLKQPRSAERAGRIDAAVDALIDFDELSRAAVEGANLTDAQRAEVRDLLHRWIARRYVRSLARVADYTVAYATPEPISPQEWRVRVEIRSARDPREPARDIDYVVRRGGLSLRVVDILTEGASLTESCRREFAKLLTDQKDGYASLVRHLKDAAVATSAF